ncbi:OCIA domain-containing protein 1 [Leptopilina heterotoma]|uniref:OCIA domain-containing protein 1 n=1 Tax=Leptopilina heterotoma TaxID=63436 RepID=UPI001CA98017|nr:OCIA domain-containing protein 1 [Leptopilina heterotoma]
MDSRMYDPTPQSIILVDRDNNRIELTAENLKVLRECSSEGFRNRAIPFAIGSGFISYMAMKQAKVLQQSFGRVPVVLFSSVAGLLLGLRSYSPICRDRLMNALKQSADGYNPNVMEDPKKQVPFEKEQEYFSQSKPTDIELPIMGDFYTSNNNVDINNLELPFESKNSETQRTYTSYENLRDRNRSEHYDKYRMQRPNQEAKPNYNNPHQPGHPGSQTIYLPFANLGDLNQNPRNVPQKSEYSEQSMR